MKVIGITGGVGAGKSAILDYIEENYNARILKADEIAHDLMEPGRPCHEKLQEVLPKEAFLEDGHLNRPLLAGLMFSKKNLRNIINSIVHPAVKVYIIDTISKEHEIGALDYLVIEGEDENYCTHPDCTISVTYHEDGVTYTTTATCNTCGAIQEVTTNSGE